MILYSVNYKGPASNYDWSIVTIHKSKESAENTMKRYRRQMDENSPNNGVKYCIVAIDTDSENGCIFDYTDVDDIYNENAKFYD